MRAPPLLCDPCRVGTVARLRALATAFTALSTAHVPEAGGTDPETGEPSGANTVGDTAEAHF